MKLVETTSFIFSRSELERCLDETAQLVLRLVAFLAIGLVDPEDGRSHLDVVGDLEVVVTLDGEVLVSGVASAINFGGIAGVGAEADSQLVALQEGILPAEANHPTEGFLGVPLVVAVGETEVNTSTDGGDETGFLRLPVATQANGIQRMAEELGARGGITHCSLGTGFDA